jgi:hypothetical protein
VCASVQPVHMDITTDPAKEEPRPSRTPRDIVRVISEKDIDSEIGEQPLPIKVSAQRAAVAHDC